MSVEDTKTIDIISTQPGGMIVLTVSDHLDWENSFDHQFILQEKLNTYLAFVESEQIYDEYPSARNRPVVVKVVFQYAPDPSGWDFLAKAKSFVESMGISVIYDLELTNDGPQALKPNW